MSIINKMFSIRFLLSLCFVLLFQHAYADEGFGDVKLNSVIVKYFETDPNNEQTELLSALRNDLAGVGGSGPKMPENQLMSVMLQLSKYGYFDIPEVLLTSMIEALKPYGLKSQAFFYSQIRPVQDIQSISAQIEKKIPKLTNQKVDYSLAIVPYRALYINESKVTLHMAVIMNNEKDKRYDKVIQNITVPIDAEHSRFTENEAKRIVGMVVEELEKQKFIDKLSKN